MVMKPEGLRISLPETDQELLRRLADDSIDAEALVALYEIHAKQIKESAIRWFGRDPEVRKKAINSILVSIGRQAGTYDPQSMDATEWIRRVADAEARRLREALDTAVSKSLRARRAM